MLPRSIRFCPDSAAANTFIRNYQGDLEARITLYFLSGELVVTKFPRAQGWAAQGTAVGWFGVVIPSPVCSFPITWGCCIAFVTHYGPDLKKTNIQIQNNPMPKSSYRPAPSMASLVLQCSWWSWDAASLGTQTPAHPAAQTWLNPPTDHRAAEPPTPCTLGAHHGESSVQAPALWRQTYTLSPVAKLSQGLEFGSKSQIHIIRVQPLQFPMTHEP